MSFSKKQPSMNRQRDETNTKLIEYANKKRLDGDFNDVTIKAGSWIISAHRMVLSCYSKFFESMFLSPMKEKYQDTVVINDFDGESVSTIIEFIYTGSINNNARNVMALLAVADFMQIEDVKNYCFEFLEDALTVENCLDIFVSSVTYNNKSPMNKTLQLISDNIELISDQVRFKELSKDELTLLVSKIRHCDIAEDQLYSVILKWIKHDENRNNLFVSFFIELDLNSISNEFIEEIAKEPLVKQSPECLNAIVARLLSDLSIFRANRKSNVDFVKIFSVGGRGTNSALEIYNITGKSAECYPALPCSIFAHCVLKVDDIIYCIGGAVDGSYTKLPGKVYLLKLKNKPLQWKKEVGMNQRRCTFGAAVLDGNIIVAGGYNKNALNSVEMYDTKLNSWTNISSLNYARSLIAMVNLDGELFAIGGYTQGSSNSISTVERLQSVNGKWTMVQSMNVPRQMFAAVACCGFVYAIGGKNDKNMFEKSVEKYDPKQNEWSYVKSMKAERWKHAACVLQNKIFVVGGQSKHQPLRSIECYDPSCDDWSIVGTTDFDWIEHAALALEERY